jgi:hypothetical protein
LRPSLPGENRSLNWVRGLFICHSFYYRVGVDKRFRRDPEKLESLYKMASSRAGDGRRKNQAVTFHCLGVRGTTGGVCEPDPFIRILSRHVRLDGERPASMRRKIWASRASGALRLPHLAADGDAPRARVWSTSRSGPGTPPEDCGSTQSASTILAVHITAGAYS